MDTKCEACNDKQWWCRGCGGAKKLAALKKIGLSEAEAQIIYETQFGECDLPLVPCYVCNKDTGDFWKE